MSAFDKIIGYEDIKKDMMMYCDAIRDPEKYRKLGADIPKGILLHGNPGLGKTLFAQCFIEESGVKFFLLRKDKSDGDFIDEIREKFRNAKEQKMAIVFLDDLDKFASEDDPQSKPEEYITVQSCIDDCKDANVFVLATANRIRNLPGSLLRVGRFDKLIKLSNPVPGDAQKIINHYLGQKKTLGNIDAEEICKIMEDSTCAELETMINEAALIAGYENRECIEQNDLVLAYLRMYYKSSNVTGEKIPRWHAVHEAGHVVASEILRPGSVSLVSARDCSDDEVGITKTCEIDTDFLPYEEKMCEVLIGLSGRAAVEIVFGIEDTQCELDVRTCYRILEELINQNCCLSFSTIISTPYSEYSLENKDRKIEELMSRLYDEAKRLMVENRAFLDRITDELMAKFYLTYRELEEIRMSY